MIGFQSGVISYMPDHPPAIPASAAAGIRRESRSVSSAAYPGAGLSS